MSSDSIGSSATSVTIVKDYLIELLVGKARNKFNEPRTAWVNLILYYWAGCFHPGGKLEIYKQKQKNLLPKSSFRSFKSP